MHARAPRHPAGRSQRRQQLLGDERVAAGALDELVHEGLLRRPAEDRLGLDGRPRRARAVPSSRTSTVGTRESSAIQGSSGWRRWSSSLRYVSTIAPGQPRLRTRYPMRSSDAGSAQWRSSNTTTSGRIRGGPLEQRPNRVEHAARDEALGDGRRVGDAESGAQGRARCARDRGRSHRARASGGGHVARPQDAAVGGRHDRGERQRRVDERRAAHRRRARSRGVEASTPSSSIEPGLADPRPHRGPPPSRSPRRRRVPRRRRSASSSAVRPTMIGLEIRRAMAAIIRTLPSASNAAPCWPVSAPDSRRGPAVQHAAGPGEGNRRVGPMGRRRRARGRSPGGRAAARAASTCMAWMRSFTSRRSSSLRKPFISAAFRPDDRRRMPSGSWTRR